MCNNVILSETLAATIWVAKQCFTFNCATSSIVSDRTLALVAANLEVRPLLASCLERQRKRIHDDRHRFEFIQRHLQTGRYDEACQQFTRWRYAAGRDCSQAGSQCRGVWERRKLERDICTGAVSIEQAAIRLGQKLEDPDNAKAN
jgi:hypothetical protein